MDSVEKTLNCISLSSRVSCQYFQYVNTLFRSLFSQNIENHLITSLKYTVITLRQNDRNRAFGMLVAATRVSTSYEFVFMLS